MTVERRIHIELRLELLRPQIRDGVAEIEIVGEMRALAAQIFVLGRCLEICGNCALRIGECTAARAHHLGEAPLFLCGDLLVGAHVKNCLYRLVDIPRVNVLADCRVVIHPAHRFTLSNLKYATSGGQPMRSGNQLPLPVWT